MSNISVMEYPFSAKGDGKTNDRAEIQNAVDYVYSGGGGTVILSAGKTFLSSGIVLRSNVELHFEDNATLLQSPNVDDYVKSVGESYEPYKPLYGHNYSDTIKWSHVWYKNYPLIYIPEGSVNVKITGKGTVRMMTAASRDEVFCICPIGLYRVSNFEISDITIADYHTYAMMPFTCDHGLIKNVTIGEWSYSNCDGICMMNCRDMRITGCKMDTGDDSLYIFSSYKDPRGGEWWSSDDPQPSVNIEIDHNDLASDNCKAFAMILWGTTCPDPEKTEVRNINIHDNHFKTMGIWLFNPYSDTPILPPVTNVRFENNVIDSIERNFFETQISDMNYYHSMTEMHNGGFDDGCVYWSTRKNTDDASAGVVRKEDGNSYGFIDKLDKGDAAIYQGLYLKAGDPCAFIAKVLSSGENCRMFIRSLDTQELIAGREFNNTEWEDLILEFTVPESGNYHLGIEKGNAEKGSAKIDDAVLVGNFEPAFGYKRITKDGGKIIFHYNDYSYD